MTTRTALIADAAWPLSTSGTLFRSGVLALAGSLLLAICAQVQVPMWPVPMTMQTFAVLLIGLAYGPRLGAATVALYLAEGAIGLPVFAGLAGGAHHLIGVTGGYLFGFVVAAGVVGLLAERGWSHSMLATALAMIIGSAIIYLLGVGWLASFLGLDQAIKLGMLPFLAGDAVKAALAALALPVAWRCLGRGTL